MIRGRNRHCIYRIAHHFEHLAEALERARIGIKRLCCIQTRAVDITKGNDFRTHRGVENIPFSFASDPNPSHLKFLGSLPAKDMRKEKSAQREGTGLDKPTARLSSFRDHGEKVGR